MYVCTDGIMSPIAVPRILRDSITIQMSTESAYTVPEIATMSDPIMKVIENGSRWAISKATGTRTNCTSGEAAIAQA